MKNGKAQYDEYVLTKKSFRTVIALAVDCGYACRDAKELPSLTKTLQPEELETCCVQVMERIVQHAKPEPTLLYASDGVTPIARG